MDNYEYLRKRMVENQIRARGISSGKVLDAMLKVNRDYFVPEERRRLSYEDNPLPIGFGQTISQPYIVALMTEQAQLTGSEKVLEVGTGSGYQCAVLSVLCKKVYSLERIGSLAARASEKLAAAGYANCTVIHRDGFDGLPEEAPFDAIVITAAPPEIPQALKLQLSPEGGRMILPVGRGVQKLLRITRNGSTYGCEEIADVVFVPMLPDITDPA